MPKTDEPGRAVSPAMGRKAGETAYPTFGGSPKLAFAYFKNVYKAAIHAIASPCRPSRNPRCSTYVRKNVQSGSTTSRVRGTASPRVTSSRAASEVYRSSVLKCSESEAQV